jgi:hypothetical protein
MNMTRSRLYLALIVLCIANFAWRIYAGWGLVTIQADGAPISTVLRSIEKQGGIQLRSNLSPETPVTMHVTKVPLLHALEVLAANTDTSWNVSYFSAPDHQSIETVIASISSGQQPEGWKRFSTFGPGMRGQGDDSEQGVSDPREEVWKPKVSTENALHAYLEQAALMTSARFWAPETWNPNVTKTPSEDELEDAIPKLAKAAGGQAVEIFLLTSRPQMREPGSGEQESGLTRARRDRSGQRGEPPTEAQRQALEERALARIEQLPEEKRAAARAEHEVRKKFREELSQLSPEERRAKMQERMEAAMNNSEMAARMENGSAKRGAMQSAEQRTERYRDYLNRKNTANN